MGITKLSFILELTSNSVIVEIDDINKIFKIENSLKKDSIKKDETKKAKEPSKVLLNKWVLPNALPTSAAFVSDIETIKRPAVAASTGNKTIDIKEPKTT